MHIIAYYLFWYKHKGKQKFKITTCEHGACYVYVNGELVGAEFTVDFGNHDSWQKFEVIQYAAYGHRKRTRFQLMHHRDKYRDLENNRARILASDLHEDRRGPRFQSPSSTSMKLLISNLVLPKGPPFTLDSHSFRIWTSGFSETTPEANDEELYTGLQKYWNYHTRIDYVGTTYTVRSNIIAHRTLADLPTAPPNNVRLIAHSSTAIQVEWDEMPQTDRNGPVHGYEVEYIEVETDGTTLVGSTWQRETTHGDHHDNRRFDVTSLEFWTHYAIRVAGRSSVGVGPFSTHVVERTLEDAPTGTSHQLSGFNTSETSLQVNWNHLQEEDTNGIILGYSVSYQKAGQAIQYMSVSGKDTLTVELTGLEWFSDYEIKVAGETAPGVGVYSVTGVIVRTDEWKPQLPPPNVSGKDISGTELEIAFDNIVNTHDIYGYPIRSKIKYERTDDPALDNGETYGDVNLATISGLNEYTFYTVWVAIQTRRGGETYSDPIQVRTDQAPPSLPPDGIWARKLSSTSVMMNCKLIPVEDRNGIVVRYNFTVREKYVGDWETHFVQENDDNKELILTDLEKWRYYEYIISGCTSKGCGVPSEMFEVRTDKDIPESSPDNISIHPNSSTILNVTWDEVPEGTRRGIITGYLVEYSDTTLPSPVWLTKTLDVEPRTVLLEELKFFTNYTVRMKAKTVKGYSTNYSMEFRMATLEDVPQAHPYNLTCNNATSRSIRCTWEPVPQIHGYANGIVRGYNIYYSVVDCSKAELADCNENVTFIDTVKVPLLEHTIEGLDNFTEYNIIIDLFNGVSTGPNTTVIVIYTDEDIPSTPPALVEGFTWTPTSVLVYWDGVPWGEKHGIILGYVVYYRRMNDGPPSDYLRRLMAERNSARKRRSVSQRGDSYYDVIYGDPTSEAYDMSETDEMDETAERSGRSRRALYDGQYLYPEEVKIVPNVTAIGTGLEDLERHQWYTVRVAAYTSKGHGPTSDFNVSCQQQVPWAAPVITTYDRYAFDEMRINWTELTYNQSRGTVFDYNIVYYPVQVNGVDLSPYDQVQTSLWFEYPIQGFTVRNLKPYVKYAFRASALTFAGVGVYSREYFGETCRCDKYFYTSYRDLPPYFNVDRNTGEEEGIMKNLINNATQQCCQSCVNGHGRTIVDWTRDKIGNNSLKRDVKDINAAILDEVEFSLPVETSSTHALYNTKPFISLIESSGIAVFSRKIEYINPTNNMILYAASIIWTFVIIFTLAVIGLGMFMWILQCNPLVLNRTNQEDFPDDFRHGAGAGVWWAVSSMMRLGYGDVIATGNISRIVSMPIILLGLVMCSTLISGMCSMYLSYVFTRSEGGLYAQRVVTLENSYDTTVVGRMGGKVVEKVTTPSALIETLRSGRVSRIAVDSLYGSYHNNEMKGDDIVFRGLKPSGSSQGIVLGGNSIRLQACFRQVFMDKSTMINERRKAIVDEDKKLYEDDEYSSKRLAIGRYESDVWMLSIQVCGGLFVGALLIGIIYECRRSRKNKIHANVLIHGRCEAFYGDEAERLFNEFSSRIHQRIEKIEVKHAFERIDLIRNLRKRVEWLTPDQVNKYKF